MMEVERVVLEGETVRLEPLTDAHVGPLCEVGLDPRLWEWIPVAVCEPGDMRKYVELALGAEAAGAALPFATVDKRSGRVIGSTRFMAIERTHRRVEIGSTWLAVPWQRTAANTEAKYLMLKHAFEMLGCIRVELKTDLLNTRSRQAILRIGAKEEGVLRRHLITSSGRIRDTVYFSIIREEWPAVRADLERKLKRGTTG